MVGLVMGFQYGDVSHDVASISGIEDGKTRNSDDPIDLFYFKFEFNLTFFFFYFIQNEWNSTFGIFCVSFLFPVQRE